MTIKEQIMKLQTYKMYEGEDTVYVERDDVLKLLEQEPCEERIVEWKKEFKEYVSLLTMPRDDYNGIMEYIDELPSITPQPKTGHWIFDEILDKHYYCSECKSMGVDYWDYCPNCGADMRGGKMTNEDIPIEYFESGGC